MNAPIVGGTASTYGERLSWRALLVAHLRDGARTTYWVALILACYVGFGAWLLWVCGGGR